LSPARWANISSSTSSACPQGVAAFAIANATVPRHLSHV
jgi:hypothetical protein